MAKTASKVKKWLIAIGIAIIFSLFVNYGVSTFYKAPDFKEYRPANCPEEKYYESIPIPMGCENYTKFIETYRPECREYENQEFKKVIDKYETNVFIVLVILGMIALILGVMMKVEAVSTGLLMGGLITLFFETARYWGRLYDYARFFILGAVLAILIWIGYKKLK